MNKKNQTLIPQSNQYVSEGLEAHKKQHYSQAQIRYEKALSLDAKNTDALHLLGMLKAEMGDTDTAILLIEEAIKLNEKIAIYPNNLGNIFFQLGDTVAAKKYFTQALSLKPDYIEAEFNLANVYLEHNKVSLAKKHYENVLSVLPNFLPAINNLVETYLSENDYVNAYKFLKKLSKDNYDSQLKNKFIDIKFNLANCYKENNKIDEAESLYLSVLDDNQRYYGALINLGVIQMWRGAFDEARDNFILAYKINDADYILLNNLGMVNQALKNIEDSQYYYKKAIEIDKDRPEAYWNYALLLLLIGDYKKGWQYYEYRWQVPNAILDKKRKYFQPVWQGEEIIGKTLFVYHEQGYGDAIQFVRYLPELLNSGVNVVLECPQSLIKLFQQLHPKLKIMSDYPVIIDFDYHIAMMSLPAIFKTTLDTIPCAKRYLRTNKEDENKWAKITEASLLNGVSGTKSKDKLKVGFVWKGNPRKINNDTDKQMTGMIDRRRSLSVHDFTLFFDNENILCYSLQKNDEKRLLDVNINYQAIDKAKDFYDTACIIENLDLVISVDTSVAHLAGALGKPVWLLSRYDGCWRWLLDREDSPWYSSVKIYRQPHSKDWVDVLVDVNNALNHYANKN